MPTEFIESASNQGRQSLTPEITSPPPGSTPISAAGGRAALITIAIAAMALVAISGRSLWIDEACTAMKAVQTSLYGWWEVMVQDKTADVQMPFYMLYVWAWARIFGSGEWSLHFANIPWVVVGAATFVLSFPASDRSRKIALLVVLCCPFAWYYLDEARPYAMQLGAGMLLVGSLRRLLACAPEDGVPAGMPLAGYLVGVVVLSGSSLLGMIWAAAAVVALPVLLPLAPLMKLFRQHWNMLLIAAGPLLLLTAYYLWTLKIGARASAAATTTVGSIFFAIYELLGFTGLGPGRLEMRSAGPSALRGHLLGVGLYGLAAALVAGAALMTLLTVRNRRRLALILCCAVPPVFILAVGAVAHFRVLGRHLAPFVPIWLLLLTLGLAALWAGGKAAARAGVVAFCILSLLSCLSVRFAPRHEKDNYRAAAAVARAALDSGGPVWWNAAAEGASYYAVPTTTESAESGARALFLMNPSRAALDALPAPRVIVASKPDIYDGPGALASYLHDRGYAPATEFTAFVIWEKNAK